MKKADRRFVHGESGSDRTPEYAAWVDMISRCTNNNHPAYARYGGRGINVCSKWRRSFKSFVADVGRRPSALHSLDRFPNNDGDYEPGNIRWATRSEQQNNRGNKVLTHQGRTLTLSQWAKELGLSRATVSSRARRGWPADQVLRPAMRSGYKLFVA